MKGITFLEDITHNKKFVQIDLAVLRNNDEYLQDILDSIIAESRKNEKEFTLSEVKNILKIKTK